MQVSPNQTVHFSGFTDRQKKMLEAVSPGNIARNTVLAVTDHLDFGAEAGLPAESVLETVASLAKVPEVEDSREFYLRALDGLDNGLGSNDEAMRALLKPPAKFSKQHALELLFPKLKARREIQQILEALNTPHPDETIQSTLEIHILTRLGQLDPVQLKNVISTIDDAEHYEPSDSLVAGLAQIIRSNEFKRLALETTLRAGICDGPRSDLAPLAYTAGSGAFMTGIGIQGCRDQK
jgi:hypothetical protein